MVSYLATATIAASLLAALPETIVWETDYGKALKATRADDQPLLVVLEKPAQEPSVQQVAYQETAVTTEDAELLAPYQLCKIDATTEYGQKVAKVFGVKQFPYTAIIDKTGSVIIFAESGELTTDEWRTTLATFKDGNRSDAVLASTKSGTSAVMFRKPYSQTTNDDYCPSCQKDYCPSCQKGY